MNKLYRDMATAAIQRALAESKAADRYDNMVLKGRAREIFTATLLRPFLNPLTGITSGIVIDSVNNHSKQVDVIVFDQRVIPPSLLQDNEGIIPVESVLATIEVKTRLTKGELRKSVRNARSVKELEPDYDSEISTPMPFKNSPICYVFAFDSDVKQKSEAERLQSVVDEANEASDVEIRVPISGICVARSSFLFCKFASQTPPIFEETITQDENDVGAILEFLVHLADGTNRLALQRSRMQLRNYLVD